MIIRTIQQHESSPTFEKVSDKAIKTEIIRIHFFMRRFPCRRCPRILRSLLSSIFTEKNDFSQKLLIHQFELENSKELPVVEAHDNLSWAELTGGFWFSILCAYCAARGELFWLNWKIKVQLSVIKSGLSMSSCKWLQTKLRRLRGYVYYHCDFTKTESNSL